MIRRGNLPSVMAYDFDPVLRPGEAYLIPGANKRANPFIAAHDAAPAQIKPKGHSMPDFDLDGANSTEIIKQLIGMVPPDKAELAGKMLRKLVGSDEPAPVVAGDAALRQRVAQGRLRQMQAGRAGYDERFPNANRLSR